MSPGQYAIRVAREGYHPWEKRLEVFPERVTFANDILLWNIATPEPVGFDGVTNIEPSPNGRELAMLLPGASSSQLLLWQPGLERPRTVDLPSGHLASATLRWSDDSRALFVESERSDQNGSWLLDVRGDGNPLPVPSGTYRWNGNALEGVTSSSIIFIQPQTGTVSRTPLPPLVRDRAGEFTIRAVTGTDELVLSRATRSTTDFILPPGAWTVHDARGKQLFLRDRTSWMRVDADADPPTGSRLTGDSLRAQPESGRTVFLSLSDGEIWQWGPTEEPELLSRESKPVREAVWHPGGLHIIVASEREVYAFGLDIRDGHLRTPLATFDSVEDIALVDGTLYVSATRGGRGGLWKLPIE